MLYDLENNVWVSFDGSGRAKVGIASVHAAMAGKLTQVSLKPMDSTLQRGQALGTIESARYFGAVRTEFYLVNGTARASRG